MRYKLIRRRVVLLACVCHPGAAFSFPGGFNVRDYGATGSRVRPQFEESGHYRHRSGCQPVAERYTFLPVIIFPESIRTKK